MKQDDEPEPGSITPSEPKDEDCDSHYVLTHQNKKKGKPLPNSRRTYKHSHHH